MFSIFKASSAATSVASFLQTFDLGEASVLPDDKHVFGRAFYHATHRSSGKRVTVFVCESPARAVVAAAAVKRIKTLRHPAVPVFVDAAVDGDRVAMATEPVTVLSKHLADTDGSDVAWGLFQVLKGISFLANDAHLVHGGLHGDAIFVSEAGDWKLFALERMLQGDASPSSSSFNSELLPYGLQKYNPPEMSDPGKRSQATAWSTDVWGFGCIIWETFNGPLPAAKNLAQLGSIPKAISSFYMECVAANPSKRPNPKDRLETMRRPGGYFKNDLIDTLVFLEEFQIKEDADKARFFGHLQTALDSFPVHICKGKILPELIKSFEFGNAGAAVIGPILRLGKLLDSNDYVEKVVPCVLKLFASNDRNARFKLLSHIESFVEHLNEKTVNEKIFQHVQNGFLDQEPLIREKTVIAMIHLAPKLSFANLDETVVLRHFARLLRDEQAGIRTNTTVCLGKIAGHLNYSTRQKVLISAFTGKMRDPFPPARIAAINALAATQQYYTVQETASRVLPALCPLLTDAEEPVRQQAFKVVNGFIQKLEQVSKDPSLREEMEQEVTSSNSNSKMAAAATWATWAVSALGSKFYKTTLKEEPAKQASETSGPAKPRELNSPKAEAQGFKASHEKPKPNPVEPSRLSAPTANFDQKEEIDANGDGWDDNEEWGSLESEALPKKASKVTTTRTSSVSSPSSSVAPKQPTSTKESSDWNDWSEDSAWGAAASVDSKKQRDEKREARKQELAAKREAKKAGPLKLGTKATPNFDDFDFS